MYNNVNAIKSRVMPKKRNDLKGKLGKKNYFSAWFIILSLIGIVLMRPMPIFAQDPPKFDADLPEEIFGNIIKISFPIAIIVATIMIIVGGYMWMISAGDPQKIKTAQGTLTWGIIGLIFLGILSFLIEVVFDIFLP